MEHTSDANIATVGDNVTDDDTHSTESLPLIRSASISYLRAEACAPMEDEQGFFVEARMDQVPIVDMTKVQGNCKHVLHRTFFFGILPLLIRTLEEWRRRWGTMPRFPPNGLISYLASIMDLQTRTLLPDNAVTTPPCICENRSSTTCVSHIYDCWWEVRGGQDRGEREKEPYCDCLLSRRPEVGVFIAAPLIMRKFMSRELRQDTVLLEKEEEFCSIPPPLIGKSVRGKIAPWELRPRADTCTPIPTIPEPWGEEWMHQKKKKKGKKKPPSLSPLSDKEKEEEREAAKKEIAETLLQIRKGGRDAVEKPEEKENFIITATGDERRVTRQTSVAVAAATEDQKEAEEKMEEGITATEVT